MSRYGNPMRKCWNADCERPHHGMNTPHWILTPQDAPAALLRDTAEDRERLARSRHAFGGILHVEGDCWCYPEIDRQLATLRGSDD